MKHLYTVETSVAPRGTAGAASRIPALKGIVHEVGGEVVQTFIGGSHLYALVSMTSKQAEALRAYEVGWISQVYRNQLDANEH